MLKTIIPSKCRRKILTLFFLDPENEFYLRQIAKLTQQPVRSVQIEIQNLFEAGIVLERRKSNRRLFKLNKKFYYYDELKQLVLKTQGVQSEVEKHLGNFKNIIQTAVIKNNGESKPGLDGRVTVTLNGNFDDLPDSTRKRLTSIKTRLPFEIAFDLVNTDHGHNDPEESKDFAREILVYQS